MTIHGCGGDDCGNALCGSEVPEDACKVFDALNEAWRRIDEQGRGRDAAVIRVGARAAQALANNFRQKTFATLRGMQLDDVDVVEDAELASDAVAVETQHGTAVVRAGLETDA
jgi:hypothetical protein